VIKLASAPGYREVKKSSIRRGKGEKKEGIDLIYRRDELIDMGGKRKITARRTRKREKILLIFLGKLQKGKRKK